jgi:hypothetical protein
MFVLTLVLPLVASRASEGDALLEFLPPAELGSQSTRAQGPAGEPAVEVIGGGTPSTTTIINCGEPAISTHRFAVRGKVKYEGVAGDGYLELWSDFGHQGQFFTRSLASWGRLQKLSGSSGWREFELPFYAKPGMRPRELTLNVVLPGAGKVIVSQPLLVSLNASHEWWTEPQAGLLGGVLGTLMGILGALIGVLSSRGNWRSLTLGLYGLGLATSGVALIAGVAAVCFRQPWHVYYPLFLVGVIGGLVLGGNLWMLFQRFQADELRRITAVDA